MIALAGLMRDSISSGADLTSFRPGPSSKQQPCRIRASSPPGMSAHPGAAYNWTTSDLMLLATSNATVSQISLSLMCVTATVQVSVPPTASGDLVRAGDCHSSHHVPLRKPNMVSTRNPSGQRTPFQGHHSLPALMVACPAGVSLHLPTEQRVMSNGSTTACVVHGYMGRP
jgi:hypothetical protein